jgi:hypothetical protein
MSSLLRSEPKKVMIGDKIVKIIKDLDDSVPNA